MFSINVELPSTFFTLQRFGPSPSPNFKAVIQVGPITMITLNIKLENCFHVQHVVKIKSYMCMKNVMLSIGENTKKAQQNISFCSMLYFSNLSNNNANQAFFNFNPIAFQKSLNLHIVLFYLVM